MKMVIREVESILYLCGFFGRSERVNLVSVAMIMPMNEKEMKKIEYIYDKVRTLQLPWFRDLRDRMIITGSWIDRFNKRQFYKIDEKLNDVIESSSWFKKIFMDKRIPRDVLRETMIDKTELEAMMREVERFIDFLADVDLRFPISEAQFNFISRKNPKIERDLLEMRFKDYLNLIHETSYLCERRLEEVSF